MTTTNEDAGLLACPFCGGKPEMYYPFHLMGNPGQAAKYHGGVRCTKCRCESRATTPTDDSIFFWNRRDASKVQVEAVRETTDMRLASAVQLMRCLKRDLMHVRRFSADTLANYRRACSSAEGDVEEWLRLNTVDAAASGGEKGVES